jgi:hypothetical protein
LKHRRSALANATDDEIRGQVDDKGDEEQEYADGEK